MSYQDDGGKAKDLMTLRDYFAAKAMQSLVAVYVVEEEGVEVAGIAEAAYSMADAMLGVRQCNDITH